MKKRPVCAVCKNPDCRNGECVSAMIAKLKAEGKK
jgi:hypothetical protein